MATATRAQQVLVAGGAFTVAGGVASDHAAQLDGALWTPMGPASTAPSMPWMRPAVSCTLAARSNRQPVPLSTVSPDGTPSRGSRWAQA